MYGFRGIDNGSVKSVQNVEKAMARNESFSATMRNLIRWHVVDHAIDMCVSNKHFG